MYFQSHEVRATAPGTQSGSAFRLDGVDRWNLRDFLYFVRNNALSMACLRVVTPPATDVGVMSVLPRTYASMHWAYDSPMRLPLWVWFLLAALLPIAGTLAILATTSGSDEPCTRTEIRELARADVSVWPCRKQSAAG
jgi:hypothetical protein